MKERVSVLIPEEKLLKRIGEMRNDQFEKERVLAYIDDIYGRINGQMVLDRMRYSDCSSLEAQRSFDESVQRLKDFFNSRGQYLDEYTKGYADGK